MTRWTKKSIEAEIANAIVQVQRGQQGRGPAEVRVHLLGDLVLVRSYGVLTQTEQRLALTAEGRRLVRSARRELRNISHAESEGVIAHIAGCGVIRSYGDMDVAAGEQIEVFVLDVDLERRLVRRELESLNGVGSPRG